MAAAVSRLHKGESTLKLCERLDVNQLIESGSALKFARLAEGTADFYPRLGTVSEWDIAAGHCLLNETGCTLICLETWAEPKYNSETLKIKGFVAAPKAAPFLKQELFDKNAYNH